MSVSRGQGGIPSEKWETRITWAALTRARGAPPHPGSQEFSGVGGSFPSLFPSKPYIHLTYLLLLLKMLLVLAGGETYCETCCPTKTPFVFLILKYQSSLIYQSKDIKLAGLVVIIL